MANNCVKNTFKNKRDDKMEKTDNAKKIWSEINVDELLFLHRLETIVGKLRLKNNALLRKYCWLITRCISTYGKLENLCRIGRITPMSVVECSHAATTI
jgi:hypothetical protein